MTNPMIMNTTARRITAGNVSSPSKKFNDDRIIKIFLGNPEGNSYISYCVTSMPGIRMGLVIQDVMNVRRSEVEAVDKVIPI